MRIISTLICLLALTTAQAQDFFHRSVLESAQNVLVSADKQAVNAKSLASKKYLFLYFSAHWCPPCRKFTPKLVEFYKANIKNGDFDLVFVSSDESPADMFTYMRGTGMPWPAVKHGSPVLDQLKKRFGGKGIPCLVLLDEKDQVLAHSYDANKKYLGPYVALEKYGKLTGTQIAE